MKFSVFGVSFYAYGFLVASGILIGYLLSLSRISKYCLSKECLERILPWIIIGGLIGARLYHVWDLWDVYQSNPLGILFLWEGGLGIFGALLGGFVGLLLAAKQYRLPIFTVLDLLAPSLALGQAIGRIGNLMNQEGFGPPANLPWAVYIDPSNRPWQYQEFSTFHPTHLYESFWLVIGVLVLLALERRLPLKRGQLFGMYLIWFGAGRFMMEFLRIDTAQIGTVKIAQVLSLVGIFLGIAIIYTKNALFRR